MLKHVLPLERLDVEEPQRRHSLRHRLRGQLPLTKQVQLVLADMLRAKMVGTTMKVFGKLLDRKQIGFCGARGVVATLEFFEHPLSELRHRKYLLCLKSCRHSDLPGYRHKCSSRRASGLVQTGFAAGSAFGAAVHPEVAACMVRRLTAREKF